MADITNMQPPQPTGDSDEPNHYAYRVEFKDGSFENHTGYMIMTQTVCAICQKGYIHFASSWDVVAKVTKYDTAPL